MIPKQKRFLDSIEFACKKQMATNKVLASLTAAQAIYESKWGEKYHIAETNNLFNMQQRMNSGKFYSCAHHAVFERYEDYAIVMALDDILLKVYDSYDQCIEDWVSYILTTRRSEKGPLKFQNIPGVTDYKKAVKFLIRDDYQRDHLFQNNDPAYESEIVTIIENNELYKWDQEVLNGEYKQTPVMYSVVDKNKQVIIKDENLDNCKMVCDNNNKSVVIDQDESVVYDPYARTSDDPFYRVRLDADAADSQILLTQNYQDAVEEAKKHTGFKVYDENNKLVHDPWIQTINITSTQPGVKTVDIVSSGHVKMLNNTPVYRKATDKNPIKFLTGKYYFYDTRIINNRARITDTTDPKVIGGKDPTKIVGFVDVIV